MARAVHHHVTYYPTPTDRSMHMRGLEASTCRLFNIDWIFMQLFEFVIIHIDPVLLVMIMVGGVLRHTGTARTSTTELTLP